MDTAKALEAIERLVRDGALARLMGGAPWRASRRLQDPCPDVVGMASVKKLALLNLAVSFLPATGEECYLEVGTYQGKSLIAALLGNAGRSAVACDDFSLFDDAAAPKNRAALERNLARHGLSDRVRFVNDDFRALLGRWGDEQRPPVGVYFFDGPHDEESQYLGVRLAERWLADDALVIVDDWRYAEDSHSFAEAGTRRAIAESENSWKIAHVLPARFNGDAERWWNGLGVLTFQRLGTPAVGGRSR